MTKCIYQTCGNEVTDFATPYCREHLLDYARWLKSIADDWKYYFRRGGRKPGKMIGLMIDEKNETVGWTTFQKNEVQRK